MTYAVNIGDVYEIKGKRYYGISIFIVIDILDKSPFSRPYCYKIVCNTGETFLYSKADLIEHKFISNMDKIQFTLKFC